MATNFLFLQQRHQRDRVMTSHDHDLSVECPGLDDDKAMMKAHKEQRKRIEKEGRDRRVQDQDDRDDHDYNRDLNLQRFPDKKKSVKKAEGFGLTAELAYEDKDAVKSKCTCRMLNKSKCLNTCFLLFVFWITLFFFFDY